MQSMPAAFAIACRRVCERPERRGVNGLSLLGSVRLERRERIKSDYYVYLWSSGLLKFFKFERQFEFFKFLELFWVLLVFVPGIDLSAVIVEQQFVIVKLKFVKFQFFSRLRRLPTEKRCDHRDGPSNGSVGARMHDIGSIHLWNRLDGSGFINHGTNNPLFRFRI